MLDEAQLKQEEKEIWCEECETLRLPRWKRWESSIAIIFDLECPKCHEIFDRLVKTKVQHSELICSDTLERVYGGDGWKRNS